MKKCMRCGTVHLDRNLTEESIELDYEGEIISVQATICLNREECDQAVEALNVVSSVDLFKYEIELQEDDLSLVEIEGDDAVRVFQEGQTNKVIITQERYVQLLSLEGDEYGAFEDMPNGLSDEEYE